MQIVAIHSDIGDDEGGNLDQEIDLASQFETESLIEACNHVATEWHEESHTIAQRLPLHSNRCPSYEIQESHLTALNISHLTNHEASGLQFLPDDVVKQWEAELKTASLLLIMIEMLDSNVNDTEENGLQPILDSYENQTNLADRHVLLGDNEKKQRLPKGSLTWKDHPYLMIAQTAPKC